MSTSFAPARAATRAAGLGGNGYPPLSRGRELEAAVDSLSSWYFEYDEPKSGWHTERIHPLPEESLSGEPQDFDPSTFVVVTSNVSSSGSSTAAAQEVVKPLSLREKELGMAATSSSNQDVDEEAKPPSLAPQKSEGSDSLLSVPQHQQPPRLPRSRGSSADHRSSWGTRTATIASTGSSSQNELVVSGWTIRGSEKKVMYHIDVRASESQLQTYTIRRSYTDFKHLHGNLSDILEDRREHYMQRKAAALANNATTTRHSMHEKEKSFFGFSTSITRPSFETSRHTTTSNNTNINRRASQEFEAAQAAALTDDLNEAWYLTFTLPPLPSAGFLSYWKRHDRSHLQNRCEMFQEILRAANQHPDLRDCYAMQSFLSIAPCAIRERGSSYVSLCEYSVPRLDLEEETRERKKLARERRRNSSAHPMLSSE
jgi:hypothetical protein